MKNIFTRILNKNPNVELMQEDGILIFNYFGKTSKIMVSDIKSIDYSWDMGVDFSHSLVFNLSMDSELRVSGCYLEKSSITNILHNEFPEFPKSINTEQLIDEGLAWGTVSIWRLQNT